MRALGHAHRPRFYGGIGAGYLFYNRVSELAALSENWELVVQLPACKSAVKGKVVKKERAWLLGGDGNNVWFKEGKRHPTA